MQYLTTRRTFLGAAGAVVAGSAVPTNAQSTDAFQYEVRRSEADWRARLSEREYHVLREGGTEFPATGTLWKDFTPGTFHCRGCDLPVYSSKWREKIDKGWVFFRHAEPNSVLTGIDYVDDGSNMPSDMAVMRDDAETMLEVHCRRCGSHLGHIVYIEGKLVHCINATALVRA